MLLQRTFRTQVPWGTAKGPEYHSSDITKSRHRCLGRGKRAWDNAKVCGWTTSTPMSPPVRSFITQVYTQRRRERQVSSSSGATLRSGLSGGLPTNNVGGETGAPVSCRRGLSWALTIPAILLYCKPGSYIHEVKWDSHNDASWPGNLCIQRYLLPGLLLGDFRQARMEIRGSSYIRKHTKQCQEQRLNFPTNTATSMPDKRWLKH